MSIIEKSETETTVDSKRVSGCIFAGLFRVSILEFQHVFSKFREILLCRIYSRNFLSGGDKIFQW